MIWNDLGAGYYDLDTIPSVSFRVVTTGEVLVAAGGTRKCAIVCRNGSVNISHPTETSDANY